MSLLRTPVSPMTARQTYVLKGVLLGKSNQDIAHELNLTDYTIKYHCRSIYQRFSVTNRVELFSRFLQQKDRFPPDVVAAVAESGRNSMPPLGNVG